MTYVRPTNWAAWDLFYSGELEVPIYTKPDVAVRYGFPLLPLGRLNFEERAVLGIVNVRYAGEHSRVTYHTVEHEGIHQLRPGDVVIRHNLLASMLVHSDPEVMTATHARVVNHVTQTGLLAEQEIPTEMYTEVFRGVAAAPPIVRYYPHGSRAYNSSGITHVPVEVVLR